MRALTIAVLMTAGLASAAAAQDAKVQKGKELYDAQKCAMCHSIGDKGNKKGPLDGVGSRISADDARAWMVDAKAMTAKTKAPRKPEMKSYTLPKDDVDAIVAYMMSLKK